MIPHNNLLFDESDYQAVADILDNGMRAMNKITKELEGDS